MALLRFEVIAELGVNCQGSVEKAKKMIQATKLANGDWVKGQYFKIEDFDGKLPDAKLKALLECELSIEDLRELKKEAEHLGLGFLATPMKNPKRIEEYMSLNPALIKIREADSRNQEFVSKALSYNIPVLISVDPRKGPYVRPDGANCAWLMTCISNYPPRLSDFEPKYIHDTEGFSSHFPDPLVPKMAVAEAWLRKKRFFWLEMHCFTPDTPIVTQTGIKDISNIRVGDFVLTHTNQFRPVTQVHARHYDGSLHIIRPDGLMDIAITPEHPLLTTRSHFVTYPQLTICFEPPKWKMVKELSAKTPHPCDHVVCPRLAPKVPPKQIVIQEPLRDVIPREGRKALRAVGRVNPTLAYNDDVAFLFGLYIAEGVIDLVADGRKRRGRVMFCFGHDEATLAKWTARVLERSFGIPTQTHKISTGVIATASSIVLASRFREWFYIGPPYHAPQKRVPPFLFPATDALIAGVLTGDGFIEHDLGRKFRLATTSKQLAWQIFLSLQALGHDPTIRVASNTRGGIVNGTQIHGRHPLFTIRWANHPSATPVDPSIGLYRRIKRSTTKEYHGLVYNLSVECDESYVAGGIMVHNCKVNNDELDAPVSLTFEQFREVADYAHSIHRNGLGLE